MEQEAKAMDQATANIKHIKKEAADYTEDAKHNAHDAYHHANKSAHHAYHKAKGMGSSFANNAVSPETRRDIYNGVKGFCEEQPYLASFLAIQALFNAIPVGVFASFVFGVVLFTVSIGVCFALFWMGAALLVLMPILAITGTFAIATWVWAVGSFLAIRKVYSMIPMSVKGVTEVDMPSGKKLVVSKTGDGFGDVHANMMRNGVNVTIPSAKQFSKPKLMPSTKHDMPSTMLSTTTSDLPSVKPSDIHVGKPSDMPSFIPSDAPSVKPADMPSVTTPDTPSIETPSLPTSLPDSMPASVPTTMPTGF